MDLNIPSLRQVMIDPLSVKVEENVTNEALLVVYKMRSILMISGYKRQRSTDLSSSLDKNSLTVVTSIQRGKIKVIILLSVQV